MEIWEHFNDIYEEVFVDDFKCVCGNTTESDGFFPCDSEGKIIEPERDIWDGNDYVCARCKKVWIYNHRTDNFFPEE